MPLFRKIVARAKSHRGDGPEFILNDFCERFQEFKEALDNAENKQEIIDALDGAVEGMGSAIAEGENEFKMRKSDMDVDDTKKFTEALKPYFDPSEGGE